GGYPRETGIEPWVWARLGFPRLTVPAHDLSLSAHGGADSPGPGCRGGRHARQIVKAREGTRARHLLPRLAIPVHYQGLAAAANRPDRPGVGAGGSGHGVQTSHRRARLPLPGRAFQCKMRLLPPTNPTAQALLAEVAATPNRPLPEARLGVVCYLQALPFQC